MKACLHFGTCGGCVSQHVPLADDVAAKCETVRAALARVGLSDVVVEEPVQVPPHSRRRAAFKLAQEKGNIVIGFHGARSHDVIDMRECLVLTPALFDLAQHLRERLGFLSQPCEILATEALTGFDLLFHSPQKPTPAIRTAMAEAMAGLGVARVTFGTQLLFENAVPQVEMGGARVSLPPGAFLQPTREGEAALQGRVLEIVGKAKVVADLFSGLGTFALPLAARAKVHAVEQDRTALAALAAAAKTGSLKPVTTEARDLFKLPLTVNELAAFDAVVLDPPRAGAQAQAKALAAARIGRIAYVSCDAGTFARDAKILVAAGFTLGPVTPVDQFLWSSHIELVAGFLRGNR